TGYGNAMNVRRTVAGMAKAGCAAVMIEDQVAPKRCGHMAGTGVVPAEHFAAKIHAAARARRNPDTLLIARTDSRAINGLDDALRRAELCLKAGADGVYIEAPQSVAELERIGQSFDAPLLVDLAEGGPAPFLTPKELASLGFAMVIYPTALIYRVAAAYRKFLDGLKRGEVEPSDAVTFEDWKRIMRFDDWAEAESGFGERR
ncbi:MAG: isocitrate lyase/phosphoenolpyruvate mutase family protein, partial [Minwuiales bacterium]|nr:isocitrate lyase/phosphoenolpyruvate mutase family protein [Minwuiales bacterium]